MVKQFQHIKFLIPLVFLLFSCNSTSVFEKGQKVIFIGDSITQQGDYISFFENYLEKEQPQLGLTIVNAGLNSETVSGLSEPIHNPPRPFLFDRLNSLLEKEKPDIAFFCYGINDGIYHPFSEEHLQKFEKGVTRFLAEMEKRNIEVILMTPCPFHLSNDKKAELLANNDRNYSWKNPYVHYDEEVIQRFRKYILSIKHPSVKEKIDSYEYLDKHRTIAYKDDPIHPNKTGHELLAKGIINVLFE